MSEHEGFEKRSSWLETTAGAALFVAWGVGLVADGLPPEWGRPLRAGMLGALILLPALGILAGCLWDFPRWTYPYVVMDVLFSMYMSNASTPGFSVLGIPLFGRELWGWRAWAPLLLAVLLGLLVRRSWKPLRALFTNIGRDWSVLTYGLFGCLPMFAFAMFDEVERSYTLWYVLPIALLLVGGAVVYLRAGRAALRQVLLAAGSVMILGLSALGPILYWNRPSQGGMTPWPSVIAVIVVLGIMFAPAWWARVLSASKKT